MKELFDTIFDVRTLEISDDVDVEISSDVNYSNVDLEITDDQFCVPSGVHVQITENYNDLVNKPSIEGVTLIGDKTFEDLNFAIDKIDCGTSTTVI